MATRPKPSVPRGETLEVAALEASRGGRIPIVFPNPSVIATTPQPMLEACEILKETGGLFVEHPYVIKALDNYQRGLGRLLKTNKSKGLRNSRGETEKLKREDVDFARCWAEPNARKFYTLRNESINAWLQTLPEGADTAPGPDPTYYAETLNDDECAQILDLVDAHIGEELRIDAHEQARLGETVGGLAMSAVGTAFFYAGSARTQGRDLSGARSFGILLLAPRRLWDVDDARTVRALEAARRELRAKGLFGQYRQVKYVRMDHIYDDLQELVDDGQIVLTRSQLDRLERVQWWVGNLLKTRTFTNITRMPLEGILYGTSDHPLTPTTPAEQKKSLPKKIKSWIDEHISSK